MINKVTIKLLIIYVSFNPVHFFYFHYIFTWQTYDSLTNEKRNDNEGKLGGECFLIQFYRVVCFRLRN